jgi:cytochrome c peroxidase
VIANKALAFEDIGRQEVTLKAGDRFKFRTPPLRNVAHTAPYGHTGAYATLEGVIRHHLDPVNSYINWDSRQVLMPSDPDLDPNDFVLRSDTVKSDAIKASNELAPSALTDSEIADLVEFLHALTDPASLDLRTLIPASVPSGLPVGD